MPFEALLAQFGVSTYTGLVGALQPALTGPFAGEAETILKAGDEAAAQNFLDRVVRQTPAEELMRKLSGGGSRNSPSGATADAATVTRHPLLFPPRPVHRLEPAESAGTRSAQWILQKSLTFAELTLELEIQLEKKDADAAVTLFEAAGVLSRKTARALRAELGSKKPKVVNEASVFVFRVVGIFLDPAVKNFLESLTRPPQEDDVNIRRYVEEKEWAVVDLFGRLTFLTPKDWADLRRGQTEGILHPLIKVRRHADLPPSVMPPAGDAESLSANELPPNFREPVRLLLPPRTMVVVGPDTLLYGGALMRWEGYLFQLKQSGVSYELRRRTIYRLLSQGRFKEAAQMIESITDLPTLARFFEDFVSGEAGEQNGYRNPEQFLNNTAVYAGKMFAELPAAKVTQIILLLYRHSRFQDQEALNQWLLLAFRAIRPRELLEEFSPALLGTRTRLPHLSTILGTLIEWEKTRILAEVLLKEGLEPNHPASDIMYAAMDRLHEYDPSFAQPFDLQTNPDAKIFDKKRWAEKFRVVRKGRVIGPLVDRIAGPKSEVKRTPFDLPATALAHRQEIYLRLREGLGKFLEEAESLEALSGGPSGVSARGSRGLAAVGPPAVSGGGKKISAVSNLVLLSLPPVEVHRLLIEATKGKPFPISELLGRLLIHQPADIVLDYFKAWGADAAEYYEMRPISQAWVALWNLGRSGENLLAEVVALALKEEAASAAMQNLMNPFKDASEDVDVMADKIEMYQTLAADPRFEGVLNPYEIFEATGVLRPGDLTGKFRTQAIGRAMKILNDVDKYGRLNVGTRLMVTGSASIGDFIRMGAESVPDPKSGQELTAEEQTRWRRRIVDLLVQLKADELGVVNYFSGQLAKTDEAVSSEAYRVLDQLGPLAQKALEKHIQKCAKATKKELYSIYKPQTGGGRWPSPEEEGIDVFSETVRVPISLRDLLQKFPFTSRAMQAYLRKQIFKTNGPYVKEFKKHGHIDCVETPEIIRELSELGDAALILLRPFARGGTDILIKREESRGSPVKGVTWEVEWYEFHPIFIPLLHLAELIGTPAAHQILADLYEQIKTHRETEIRGGYFSAEHPIPQTPLRLILRALVRLEAKPGYIGPMAVDTYADFLSCHILLQGHRIDEGSIELKLAIEALEKIEDISFVAKAVARAWEEYHNLGTNQWNCAPKLMKMFRENILLFNAILGSITSPDLYWSIVMRMVFVDRGDLSPYDFVRRTAFNEDTDNLQRGIAIKALFQYLRGHPPFKDISESTLMGLKHLYTSGLAARYADPEDVKYFESQYSKRFGP